MAEISLFYAAKYSDANDVTVFIENKLNTVERRSKDKLKILEVTI